MSTMVFKNVNTIVAYSILPLCPSTKLDVKKKKPKLKRTLNFLCYYVGRTKTINTVRKRDEINISNKISSLTLVSHYNSLLK